MAVIQDRDDLLPVQKIGEIMPSKEPLWLIEHLWQMSAAGIIGGQPKCCKSWLGLEMAVAVACGEPCLGRFKVTKTGPALIYLAEDASEQVRGRIEGICRARSVALSSLNLLLITMPSLRLDLSEHQRQLKATIAAIRPRLLLLDPLVRLHRLDENSSREISGLLGYIRDLQREFDLAVVLTHHSSKRERSRPGQGLRGSGDLHAFGDSNIYLARKRDGTIHITTEHRGSATIEPFAIELLSDGDSAALSMANADLVQNNAEKNQDTLSQRITEHLSHVGSPISKAQLREALRVNNQKLGDTLHDLQKQGVIVQNGAGWSLSVPQL